MITLTRYSESYVGIDHLHVITKHVHLVESVCRGHRTHLDDTGPHDDPTTARHVQLVNSERSVRLDHVHMRANLRRT